MRTTLACLSLKLFLMRSAIGSLRVSLCLLRSSPRPCKARSQSQANCGRSPVKRLAHWKRYLSDVYYLLIFRPPDQTCSGNKCENKIVVADLNLVIFYSIVQASKKTSEINIPRGPFVEILNLALEASNLPQDRISPTRLVTPCSPHALPYRNHRPVSAFHAL